MKKYSPTELFVQFMDEICPYNYTKKFNKEAITQKLNEFLESIEIIEKDKWIEEFFKNFREGKDFFDYIEYKDTDLHRTDRRHLDNLEDDIQNLIEIHKQEEMHSDLLKYVKENLEDNTYYIRKYYNTWEINRRIEEYFEQNDIKTN